MPAQVFISYSSNDRTVANMVCALLEERGHRCWIAPRDIVPGREWGESIVGGIKEATLFVLIFSQHANTSPQILREVERAVNRGLPIIPFRIEDVMPAGSMEYFMSVPHWFDALSPPVEDHVGRLAAVIEQLTSGEADARTYHAAPPRGIRGIDWNNGLVRALAGGGGVALLLLAAWLGGLAPPESPIGWLAALLAIGVAALAGAGRRAARAADGVGRVALGVLLLLAAVGYGWTYSHYVVTGVEDAPLVRGSECTADARLVYESDCPDLPSDALADAAYDAAALWTAASIGRIKIILGSAWAIIAVAGAALVAGWLGAPRRIKQEG